MLRECSPRKLRMSVTVASKGNPRRRTQSRCVPLVMSCWGRMRPGETPGVGRWGSSGGSASSCTSAGERGSRLRLSTCRHAARRSTGENVLEAVLMRKAVHGITPHYITNMIRFTFEVNERDLRSGDVMPLYKPLHHIDL